LCYLAEF